MSFAEVYLTCPITLLHRRYHRLSPTVFIFVFTLDAAYNWCFSIEGIVTVAVLASLCSHRLCLALTCRGVANKWQKTIPDVRFA